MSIVFSWGSNKYGKLGLGLDEVTSVFLPAKLSLKGIRKIRCGTNHSLALDHNGVVFSWGSGESGELGLGSTSDEFRPQKVLFDGSRVVQLALGAAHSLFVDGQQRLWSCGDNKYSQTGVASSQELSRVLSPKKIAWAVQTKKVAAGDAHSIILGVDGVALTWGYGEVGQLGVLMPDQMNFISQPTKVNLPDKVTKVYAGSLQSFFLMTSGHLYGCGLNDQCQLGLETDEDSIPFPVKILPLSHGKVERFRVGCSHSICLFKDKNEVKLFGWGMNKHGQLGADQPEQVPLRELPLFPGEFVRDVAAGGYHTGFLVDRIH